MITFEQAVEIAKESKPEIDQGTEYENCYIFGYSGDEYSIGPSPVVVLKEDGKLLLMVEFEADTGEEIKSFEL